MRALVYDPEAAHGVRFAEVAEPRPAPNQALIRVEATSLNFGELAFPSWQLQPGDVFGKDAAGIVVEAAADGSGPRAGTRVTSFAGAGGWAERRAVDTQDLAAVPDAVGFAAAAAVPAAGVSALQAVRRLGAVLGRRVLVTGASGGVGRFAVQLAARAGAHVIAAVGHPERGLGLPELGAAEVLAGAAAPSEEVAAVLDNIGGPALGRALERLEDGGIVLSVGWASREPTVVDFENVRMRGGRRRIEPFTVTGPFGADTAYLMDLLRRGELDPQIGWQGPWERVGDAIEALLGRRLLGKAVLELAA